MRYYIIVGEASGDLHASNLMLALKSLDSEADFRYYGGDLMQAVGGTLVKHYKELAYMGFIPVLTHLGTIMRNMQQCKADIEAWHPDALILVDYPGFNLNIAKYIKSHTDIPVLYYISPKIWAWKEYRIKAIKRDIDRMFSILPFEVDYYKKHDYNIDYVGNPCVDAVSKFRKSPEGQTDFQSFAQTNGLDAERPVIAILAGSRKQEVKDNLGMMINAASTFNPDYQLVIAGMKNLGEDYYLKYIPRDKQVSIVFDQTYSLLHHATAALVTSGTATLETAIFGVPQVVCYYMPLPRLTSFLRQHLLKVKYISLVNLIAGKEVVQELVDVRMRTDEIRQQLRAILPGGEQREPMLADYARLMDILGTEGASTRAAEGMLRFLRKTPTT
ncbi:MAG: lipid-A-disaccharide synthase [Bacteroidaceae bacterium]|nr:lipid-A-disaccharide synthase [Bacteroidaceae bacterium]